MHLYVLSKVWQVFQYSSALTLALVLCGIAMTFSPLIVWQIERLDWRSAAVAASWVICM